MATHIELLTDSIKTIGRTLPLGMEVHFWREASEPNVRMEIVRPDGSSTRSTFTRSDPLPAFPLAALVREFKLEKALRDLLFGIELHVSRLDAVSLKPYIESAEQLLGEDWEVDATHPANWVTSVPAAISYPVGSLGEPLEVV